MSDVKVAIATDWLTSFGGAERVIAELRVLYPGAPVYTSVFDPAQVPAEVKQWDVRTSYLQRLPIPSRYSRSLLPLMAGAFARFDFSGYDVVVTVSGAFAKNVVTSGNTRNVCYCLTPPRYLWDMHSAYVGSALARAAAAPARHALRRADLAAAARVHDFVAISRTVAERVERTYGRAARVLYPPVDTARFAASPLPNEDYYLVVSRLVRYKRIDLAIEAANRLKRPLIVVGTGPEFSRLRALAGPTVRLAGRLDDLTVADLYARCRAFLFPGLEDFGIAPVEAQAAGRPVIAFGCGGAAETVVDGVTGIHFAEQSVDSLVAAIERLDTTAIDPEACRRNASRFDSSRFRAEFDAALRGS